MLYLYMAFSSLYAFLVFLDEPAILISVPEILTEAHSFTLELTKEIMCMTLILTFSQRQLVASSKW